MNPFYKFKNNRNVNKNVIKQVLYQNESNVVQSPTTNETSIETKPNKHNYETIQDTQQNKIKRLDIVMTCVNYNDFLIVSLTENIKIINPKSITVVTDLNDILTKQICDIFGVNCVQTDRFYENGAVFNKGKGLNEGIKSISDPDWIIMTDADIVFPPNFISILNNKFVDTNKLYSTSRYLCRNYTTLEKYRNNEITLSEMDGVHHCPPVGYFQMFNYNHPNLTDKNLIYPEVSNDASWSDMLFADKFPQKECILTFKLIHLGEDSQNWKGRKTKRFITDTEFQKLIDNQQYHPFTQSNRITKKENKLAIITSFFNPAGYSNLTNNYNKFKDAITDNGGDLFTIELSFNGEYVTEKSKWNIHISGNDENIMWQKERLLNILIDNLPEEYNNIAWVDCDVLFNNEDWINETNEMLNKFQMVQLFEFANMINGNNQIESVHTGIIKKLINNKSLNRIDFDHVIGGHPGFAWAARRELLEKYHLMEYQIAGNADGLMLLTILDKFVDSYVYNLMNEFWINETLRWGNLIKKEINNSLGCISGTVTHLYHGKIGNRKYVERCAYLTESNYDPHKDVKIDTNGLLKWNGNKINLHDKMKKYFIDRKEDDNITFDINEYFDGIYCINLQRRQDKWNIVNERFKNNGINVTKFNAFDGDFISVKQEWEYIKSTIIKNRGNDIFNDPNILSNMGIIENEYAYGTLCSQIQVIIDAKRKNLKRILVFEDDVIFHKEFKNKIKQINTFDWQLLYLGASQYNWDNITNENGFYVANKTLGGFAYAIDSSIYDDILNSVTVREKSFDNVLTDFIQTNKKNKCLVFYPNIVIADVRYSDLREPRNLVEHGSILKWDISLYDV